jgi:WXG100 family type VII secretion target
MSITYNFGAIGDVSTAIGTYQGNLDVELGDLYNAFRQMFANDWSGAAGQACEEAQAQWNQGATEIKEALARLGLKLGASAERMQEVDSRISAGF